MKNKPRDHGDGTDEDDAYGFDKPLSFSDLPLELLIKMQVRDLLRGLLDVVTTYGLDLQMMKPFWERLEELDDEVRTKLFSIRTRRFLDGAMSYLKHLEANIVESDALSRRTDEEIAQHLAELEKWSGDFKSGLLKLEADVAQIQSQALRKLRKYFH